jgi:hypothetical protein
MLIFQKAILNIIRILNIIDRISCSRDLEMEILSVIFRHLLDLNQEHLWKMQL